MSTRFSKAFASGLRALSLLMVCSLGLLAAVPTGWVIAGDNPKAYESGVDAQMTYAGHTSAYLKGKTANIKGFGTLMQDFRADHYLGKRVRFSALVKSENAQDWAGLWMRVDKGHEQLAFDNMQGRSIKGTTDWKRYDVVLDVPSDATGIFFGVLLSGSGTVWLSDAKFETVAPTVSTTGEEIVRRPDEPRNLDFAQ